MFDITDYIKEKLKKEPRLVWISHEDRVVNGSHIYVLADNSDWERSTTLSTDGLQPLSNNPQAQMAIIDERFQHVLENLFGEGA